MSTPTSGASSRALDEDQKNRHAANPATAHLRPELPEAAFHGLAGDVARALSLATGADPAAILLTFLTMLGSCVGPEPHVWFGGAFHPARLFTLLVGDAAHGLKGTSVNAVERLFAQADPDWHADRIHTGVQSPEAMIELVADGPDGDCRLLMLESECARLVSRSATSGTFSALLCRAFDGPPLQLGRSRRGANDTRSSVRSSHAHISLFGSITPEQLVRVQPRALGAGGLQTRLLYGLVHRQAEVNPFQPRGIDEDALIDRLREVIESSRARVLEATDPISRELCIERGVQPRVTMPVTRAVKQMWSSLSARLPVIRAEYQGLLHRGPVLVIRLALAYAIADGSSCVAEEHINAALALWHFCATSAERIFSTPTGSLPPRVDPKRRAQLFEFVCREGGWVSRTQIECSLFRRNLAKSDVDAIVEDLKDDGLVEERRITHTGGRPRIEYRVTGLPVVS